MQIGIAEARKQLSQLIQAVEQGEPVLITRNGKPVAQLTPPLDHKPVRLGAMRNRIRLLPGWDRPISLS